MAYGAGRVYLSQLVAPVTSKIPLGNYADEVVLGVGGYLLAKKGNGMVRDFGRAMLTVEAAAVGHQLMSQGLGSVTTGNNGQTW